MKKLLLIAMMSAAWNDVMHAMDTMNENAIKHVCANCITVGPVNWVALASNAAAIHEVQIVAQKENESREQIIKKRCSANISSLWTEEDLKCFDAFNQRLMEEAEERRRERRRIQQENWSVHGGRSSKQENKSRALVLYKELVGSTQQRWNEKKISPLRVMHPRLIEARKKKQDTASVDSALSKKTTEEKSLVLAIVKRKAPAIEAKPQLPLTQSETDWEHWDEDWNTGSDHDDWSLFSNHEDQHDDAEDDDGWIDIKDDNDKTKQD
jgi:hypothetical protein